MKQKQIGYRFGEFELDLKNRLLKRGDQVIALNSKYFDVLCLLVENHHQLTSKQHIFDQVWKDTIVTDSALSQCIKDIRKSLGDDAHHPRFIKTIAKHGYMFIADVQPILELETVTPRPGTGSQRPYKFLDYYTEDDRQLFFGREHEIDLLASKILTHRNFLLYGKSGVGKSSLVRAGLLPALKDMGHHAFVIRSFYDPADQFLSTLGNFLKTTGLKPQTISFDEQLQILKQKLQNQILVFFFDQFEDFFLLLSETRKKRFFDLLHSVFADDQLPLHLVFVLREDLLAEMSVFKSVLPQIFHYEYRLLRLTEDQAIRAILQPARLVNCPFEKKLAQTILKDLANGNENIDPPQLQIVCDALYDMRHPQKGITFEQYESLGGVSRILENYMARVLHRFDAPRLELVKEILKALIDNEDQRLVLPVEQLLDRLKRRDRNVNEILDLLNELSDARLIRLGRQEGANWVELSHDFLIPQISTWISDEERNIRRARAMLERAMDNYRHHGLLLDEDAIQIILPFEHHLKLSQQEAQFLARSMIYRRYILPEWLKKQVTGLADILQQAAEESDPAIRICAVESCLDVNDAQIEHLLFKRALWDENLNVRKTASIVYLKNFGAKGQMRLAKGKNEKKANIFRRAISLSFVRDYDIHLVYLRKLPVFIGLLVVTGLIWVRLYRNRRIISREIMGATLGATFSGFLVGLLLTLLIAVGKHAQSFEAITYLLVLISLGALATFFAGLGISTGIVFMRHITYRHSLWWTVMGGTLGGLFIGSVINLIGVDILRALFGQELIDITGAFEGAVLGFCLSLGFTLAEFFYPEKHLIRTFIVALFTTLGAITLSLFEGNLFSGSIAAITRSFANAEINLEPLASLLGERQFGLLSRIVLSSMEGFLFGGLFMVGMYLFDNTRKME